jgi:alpha-glucuronidase
MRTTLVLLGATALLCALPVGSSLAEDGYRLWLRYAPLPPEQRNRLDRATGGLLAPAQPSPATQAALDELQSGLSGLLDRSVPLVEEPVRGAIVLGTPDSLPLIQRRSSAPVTGL